MTCLTDKLTKHTSRTIFSQKKLLRSVPSAQMYWKQRSLRVKQRCSPMWSIGLLSKKMPQVVILWNDFATFDFVQKHAALKVSVPIRKIHYRIYVQAAPQITFLIKSRRIEHEPPYVQKVSGDTLKHPLTLWRVFIDSCRSNTSTSLVFSKVGNEGH